MAARKIQVKFQPYPREKGGYLASQTLFPQQVPALSDENITSAIERAFTRSRSTKVGAKRKIISKPADLVDLCIQHLKTRSCPVVGTHFYSQCDIEEIFELDAIPYEMQRRRMDIGVFYQYLIIELMRESSHSSNSNIEAVFDGSREGDLVADIKTPELKAGLRLYGSVKKSSDTVGGQDVPGVTKRLESVAKEEKNLTRPYLCVFCYATPTKGKIRAYDDSRSIKCSKDGHPFSVNCESWEPGFIFPFISGRSAFDVYKLSVKKIGEFMPFYSLQYKKKCSHLLKEKVIAMGLVNQEGQLDQDKFLKFIAG
jgi:hypothetical protein